MLRIVYIWGGGGSLLLSLRACVGGHQIFTVWDYGLYPDLSRNKSSMLHHTRISHFIWCKCCPVLEISFFSLPFQKKKWFRGSTDSSCPWQWWGKRMILSGLGALSPLLGSFLSWVLLDLSEDPRPLVFWTLFSQDLGKLRSHASGQL